MQVINHDWEEAGLEAVSCCPVCGCDKRISMHEAMTDRVHPSTPGTWTLSRCVACRSGYLNPRPTPETIHQAYATYPTHQAARRPEENELGALRRLQRSAANGYRNFRYGTKDRPSSLLGVSLLFLRSQRSTIDVDCRHLPKAPLAGRLLDVGCGDGLFLDFARRAGWSVSGVDFDEDAVNAARSRGLDIGHGGVDAIDPNSRFDGITLGHVIEHVYDPVATLKDCYKLLKPGGWIWLQTPNLDSIGHERYGANWRGLEPPRHLVLFTLKSMKQALAKAGFIDASSQQAARECSFTFDASERIAGNVNGIAKGARGIRSAHRRAVANPELREYITIKAWK